MLKHQNTYKFERAPSVLLHLSLLQLGILRSTTTIRLDKCKKERMLPITRLIGGDFFLDIFTLLGGSFGRDTTCKGRL